MTMDATVPVDGDVRPVSGAERVAASTLLAPRWEPSFPSPELIGAAASLLTPMPSWDGREGPRARLVFGPGVVQVARHDPARAERSADRERDASWKAAVIRSQELLLEHRQGEADDALRALGELASAEVVSWREVEKAGDWADFLRWSTEVRDREDSPGPARISIWSRKSRANMVRTLAGLDYGPLFEQGGGLPAMLTLTYPGDWVPVAPDAATCKRHVDTLKRRFLRAYKRPLIGVWKREFQTRGAPHYHIHMVPPVGTVAVDGELLRFREWVSRAWAEIVGAESCGAAEPVYGPGPDGRAVIVCCERHRHLVAGTGIDYAEGMRARDPKRLAIYFSKHGAYSAKEYQNEAPAIWRDAGSVGRFWGVWGLEPATRTVEVSDVESFAAARTIRRWQNANGYRVQRTVWRTSWRRVNRETGELVPFQRKSGSWSGARMRGSAGFVVVNDGASFVSQLARYLDQVRERAQAVELDAWASSPARIRGLDADAAPAVETRCCPWCGSRLSPDLWARGRHVGDDCRIDAPIAETDNG